MGKIPSLHHKVIVNIVVLVVVIAAIGSFINVFMFYKSIQKNANDQIDLISTHVINTLAIQDKIHLSYERFLHRTLEQPMLNFQAEYERCKGDVTLMDLDKLRTETGSRYDYFIIDSQNTISQTTFAPDKGLDLGKYEKVGAFLSWVREHPEIIHSERAMVGVNDYLKKFIYQATPDKKYILEIGVPFKSPLVTGNSDITDFDFPQYIAQIMAEYPVLKIVNIYDHTGKAYYQSNSPDSYQLEGDRFSAFKNVVSTTHSSTLTRNDTLYRYVYFRPFEAHQHGYAEKIIEVAIDTKPLHADWMKSVYLSLLVTIASLILAAFTGMLFTNSVAKPIVKIIDSVKRIASGDLSTPLEQTGTIKETHVLSHSVETMRRKLQAQFKELELRNKEISDSYQLTIKAFFRILEHREQYTAEHSLKVNQIAMRIGKEMELSPQELQCLEWGTLLHDIGKLAINDEILLKPGKLTEQEYITIKKHPVIGYDVLPKLPFFQDVAQVVYCHHERYDGRGYPNGISGEQIPLLARICAVADTVHAMTSDRPYRKGCQWEDALKEIKCCSGTQFDPDVVNAFLRTFANQNSPYR